MISITITYAFLFVDFGLVDSILVLASSGYFRKNSFYTIINNKSRVYVYGKKIEKNLKKPKNYHQVQMIDSFAGHVFGLIIPDQTVQTPCLWEKE